MKTVILAGGLGTIISKESHLKPKPMFESGERQRLELEYFSKRSFWFDIWLIFKTIPSVLSSKGAK